MRTKKNLLVDEVKINRYQLLTGNEIMTERARIGVYNVTTVKVDGVRHWITGKDQEDEHTRLYIEPMVDIDVVRISRYLSDLGVPDHFHSWIMHTVSALAECFAVACEYDEEMIRCYIAVLYEHITVCRGTRGLYHWVFSEYFQAFYNGRCSWCEVDGFNRHMTDDEAKELFEPWNYMVKTMYQSASQESFAVYLMRPRTMVLSDKVIANFGIRWDDYQPYRTYENLKSIASDILVDTVLSIEGSDYYFLTLIEGAWHDDFSCTISFDSEALLGHPLKSHSIEQLLFDYCEIKTIPVRSLADILDEQDKC